MPAEYKKYIRTKDTIFEVVGENDKVYYVKAKEKPSCIYGKSKCQTQVIKSADNLEELCDEFVRVSPSIHDFLVSDDIPTKKFDDTEIYGAVWVATGLKYVAKLNEEGNLELI